MALYLVVGVDQEGDPAWDVLPTIQQALAVKVQLDECAFEPMKVYLLHRDGTSTEINDDASLACADLVDAGRIVPRPEGKFVEINGRLTPKFITPQNALRRKKAGTI
jgi:hypothetical protein